MSEDFNKLVGAIKDAINDKNRILGWAVLYLLPKNWILGFGRLAKWYEKNGYYCFRVGTLISLKNPRIIGYGLRPYDWKILGYTDEGKYIIDVKGTEEIHFKYNIEHHFTYSPSNTLGLPNPDCCPECKRKY